MAVTDVPHNGEHHHRDRWQVRRPHKIGAYGFYKLGMAWHGGPFPPDWWGFTLDGGAPLATGPGIVDGGVMPQMIFRIFDGGRP